MRGDLNTYYTGVKQEIATIFIRIYKCLTRGNYELRIRTRYWSRVARMVKRASFEPIKYRPLKI